MSRVLLAIALSVTAAFADPPAPGDADPAVHATARHAVYVDVLGRAGLWGVGYDFQVAHWLAVGAAASYYSFDGDRITTVAPYIAAYLVGRGHHRGFLQLGPNLVHRTTPSPVPEWNGMTTMRIGAELCGGYEYRNHFLLRVYAMASQGDHLVPWLGVSLGWAL